MKQLNFLKRKSLLFLGLMAMFLHSCQYDDFSHKEDNHQNKLNVKIEQKTLEQLMQDKNFVNAFDKVPKQKTPSLNSVVAKTVMEQDYDFIISEDIPAKVITTEEVISYTFHISRNGHFSDNSFENLVVLTDSLNTVSAYVIKYNLLSEPIYLNEHDSYIIDSEKEVIPISFNNSQARISVIGNDGCTVLTLMCPYDHPHPAGAGCIAEDRGDLYWVADSSGCGNGGGGSGSGNSGTPPGNGNSNGNQNGGGNGNGGTRSVSPIVTTPVGLDGVAIKDPCINAAQANQKSKNILNEPAFQQKLNQINGTIPTDTVEKGFTFGIRPEDNNFAVSEVQTGTATGINLPSTNPNFNVTGNIHTHPAIGFDSFSPSDFMVLQLQTQPTQILARCLFWVQQEKYIV